MTLQELKPIIVWLETHPQWSIFFAFAIAFIESIAVLGLIVPGALILTALGVLLGAGILPVASIVLVSILGAFLGDVLSFTFGRIYSERVEHLPFLNRHLSWIETATRFCKKHGGKSIFIGRFIGPLRPLLPLIAGMLKMSWVLFICADLLSAIVWAPVYMLPGFIIGTASKAFEPDIATRFIIYLLVLICLVWLLFWLLRKNVLALTNFVNHWGEIIWQHLKSTSFGNKIISHLKKVDYPNDHSQLLLTALAGLFLISFILLAALIVSNHEVNSLNIAVWHLMRSFYLAPIQKIMVAISLLASPQSLVIFWMVLTIYFVFTKQYRVLVHWFLLGLSTIILVDLSKNILLMPRPGGLMNDPQYGSFPSGHTTLSVSLFSFIAYLYASHKNKNTQTIIFSCAAFVCACIAFSRLYLGVHWFNDVLGGTFLGMGLCLLAIMYYRRKSTHIKKPAKLFITILLALGINFGWQIHRYYQHDVTSYQPLWPIVSISESHWWQQGLPDFPLYRKNRLGRPIQTLNIQWLGNLIDLQSELEAHGWQQSSNPIWLDWINYFVAKDQSHQLPINSGVFNDRRPVLEMTKFEPKLNKLIILRLWLSHVDISDSDLPLYVGAVNFKVESQFHWNLHFEKKLPIKFEANDNPLYYLSQDLADLTWKSLYYPKQSPLNHHEDLNWNGYVLMIRAPSD